MGLLKYRQPAPDTSCLLECTLDLGQLFASEIEYESFNKKWANFLISHPDNPKIFKRCGQKLIYRSEQLVPERDDSRPPLLLVFGNPASHSVQRGMFFSFESGARGKTREYRFWKNILKPAGILNLPFNSNFSLDANNDIRRDVMLSLKYDSIFRIGLCVFISIPSAPGGIWGGVAGVNKLFGKKAMEKLESAETKRIIQICRRFIYSKGTVVTFQKDAWNALRSAADPEYKISLANAGQLRGTLKSTSSKLFGVPPTRLTGPCSRILKTLLAEAR